MSAPDFIWAMPDAQDWEWGSCAWDVRRPLVGSREYVRRAPAVLAELPEVRALVAAALQRAIDAAKSLSADGDHTVAYAILAMLDTDHAAALEAVRAQAREEERDRAAKIARRFLTTAEQELEKPSATMSQKRAFGLLRDTAAAIEAAILARKVQP